MSNQYGWMPGWLRKFLNLDDDMPGYDGAAYRPQADYAPPARPAVTYTPTRPAATYTPAAATYTPNYPAAASAEETPRRFAPSYTAPPAAAEPTGEAPTPRATTYAPPPTPPATVGTTGTVQPGETVTPAGNARVAGQEGYGYVQPIGYGLRSYARGTLPPQGLEQFTREFRATLTDVWNFYSYWTRFQTDELFRIGKEAMDSVVDNLPSTGASPSSGSTVRRIKVTTGNGDEKKIDRVATTTTVDPPPVPTPAARPAPPPPTARFSPTVTADDAVVPPTGRDAAADFAAKMATTTAEVQRDIAEETAPIAEKVAEASAAAAERAAAAATDKAVDTAATAADAVTDVTDDAIKTAADKAKDAGSSTKK